MTRTKPLNAPFPYFGGKRNIAEKVWDLLGDVAHYVEPFAGSAAVLLRRPANHARKIETINDNDGHIVNTWRAIQQAPDDVAEHAAPLNAEIEMHARKAFLQEHSGDLLARLGGDPDYYDPRAAGWWLFVASTTIGEPLGQGPWHRYQGRLVDSTHPGHDPRRCAQGISRAIPSYGKSGEGVASLTRTRTHATKRESLAHVMRTLSDRLEHVRITSGDWRRVLKNSVLHAGQPTERVGVLLDPPLHTRPRLLRDNQRHCERINQRSRSRMVCNQPTYRERAARHPLRIRNRAR